MWLAILQTLADHQRDQPENPILSFTELRERAGIEDSGLFNYHLEKLINRFIRDTDAGYELGYRGERVLCSPTAAATGADAAAGCPVCGEEDCNRSIHVHLGTPTW